MPLSRRLLLASAAAAATAAASPAPVWAQPAVPRPLLLSGAQVLTMDPALGDLPRGDVLVAGGRIAAVAPQIDSAEAERRDLSGHLLLPGLVDTHWHMWNGAARGLPASSAGGFAATMAALAAVWTPEASALGVRLAASLAIRAGITCVHNWAHNIAAPAFAQAELAALRDSGLRGRFGYGYPQALVPEHPMDLDDLAALAAEGTGSPRLSLGAVLRGPDRSAPAIWRQEWRAVRALGLPLSAHIASTAQNGRSGAIAAMAAEGFLGRDLQIVHATHASRDDFRAIADSGTALSLSPWTELEVGYGVPPVAEIAAAGLRVGLSVDNTVLAGAVDLFSVMRLTADLAAGQAQAQQRLSDRQVLHWATLGGAESLGLDAEIGSLTPGKCADIVAVRAAPPFGSADFLLTHMAGPADVAMTVVDGRVLQPDPDVEADAAAAIAALLHEAGLSGGR